MQHSKNHRADTQEYITPHALNIEPELIGLALASPIKRLLAIALDLAIIALLTHLNGGIAVLIGFIFFLRYIKKSGHSISFIPKASRARIASVFKPIMWMLAALLLVVIFGALVVWWLLGDRLSQAGKEVEFHGIELTQQVGSNQAFGVNAFLTTAEKSIGFSDCESVECWTDELFYLAVAFPDMGIDADSAGQMFTIFAAMTNLNAEGQQALVSYLNQHYGADASEDPRAVTAPEIEQGPQYSIVDWAMSLMTDLGLGVSWMALYFTLFTSVANGRTPGKRIMGTRVIKLDASPITFWDSFFRYGGYAAGITTGLLGYLQIYWDANRQAIQDKISATVVIDTRKSNISSEEATRLGL